MRSSLSPLSPTAITAGFVVATAGLVAPQLALACGGCFSPPTATVDQTVVQDAERVLFVRDEKTKKSVVWVEVRYSGLAKDFGWVLPVPKLPKVGVGSRIVFDALDARMRMRYAVKNRPPENCRDPYEGCDGNRRMDSAFPSAGNAADAVASADSGATKSNEATVEVLASGATGPYDYVVIKGSDGQALYDWLTKRGYATPQKAIKIIQSHVDLGDLFVAVKLSNGQGVEAIRPIALDMEDAEPCVPLRLTSIAAAADMSVIVTIAGPGRAVVKNHLDVVPNPLRMALTESTKAYLACEPGSGTNFCMLPNNMGQVVSAAIDEAGGRAFVTEAAYEGAQLKALSPLQSFNLTGMSSIKDYDHLGNYLANSGLPINAEIADTLEPVLQLKKNFPKVEPAQMLANLKSCAIYWTMPNGPQSCNLPGQGGGLVLTHAQLQAFSVDGAQLAKTMQEGIIDPLFAIGELLSGSAKVTRLSMRISPEEMDRDPVFAYNPTLPNVSPNRVVEINQVCSNGWYDYSSGKSVPDQRLSIDGLGSWVITNGNNAADLRFKDAPAALAMYVQEEQGAPIGIAPAQAGVIDMAIAGAKPGKKSVPAELVLVAVKAWTPPKSDQLVTKLGAWKKPQWCTAKAGWTDGSLPPTAVSNQADAGATDGGQPSTGTVPGIDAAGGWDDAQAQAPGTASKTSIGRDSACTAGRTGSNTALGLAMILSLVAGLALRRRGKVAIH